MLKESESASGLWRKLPGFEHGDKDHQNLEVADRFLLGYTSVCLAACFFGGVVVLKVVFHHMARTTISNRTMASTCCCILVKLFHYKSCTPGYIVGRSIML